MVIADFDKVRADAVAAEITQGGGTAIGVECDVANSTDYQAVRDLALDQFHDVDIVVNNVGVHAHGRPEDIPLDEWERVLSVNLMSVVQSIGLFVPAWLARHSGHLVNVASINGLYPFTYDRLPYTASKAAIVALSESLGMYLMPRGVGVTCVCPGPVADTRITEHMPFYGRPRVYRGPGLSQVPPDLVAEYTVDAIKQDIFLVLTHPEVAEIVGQRGQGIDSFLRRQTQDMYEHDLENGQVS